MKEGVCVRIVTGRWTTSSQKLGSMENYSIWRARSKRAGGNVQLYRKDGMIYVEVVTGYLLCIGREDEVAGKSEKEIIEMICHALALAHFRELSGRQTIN